MGQKTRKGLSLIHAVLAGLGDVLLDWPLCILFLLSHLIRQGITLLRLLTAWWSQGVRLLTWWLTSPRVSIPRAGFTRDRKWKCKALGWAWKVVWYHFCHRLLIRAAALPAQIQRERCRSTLQ